MATFDEMVYWRLLTEAYEAEKAYQHTAAVDRPKLTDAMVMSRLDTRRELVNYIKQATFK